MEAWMVSRLTFHNSQRMRDGPRQISNIFIWRRQCWSLAVVGCRQGVRARCLTSTLHPAVSPAKYRSFDETWLRRAMSDIQLATGLHAGILRSQTTLVTRE